MKLTDYHVAKTIRAGDVVALRGNTFVRVGKRGRAFGVMQQATQQRILTDAGWALVCCPRGIVTNGPAVVTVHP